MIALLRRLSINNFSFHNRDKGVADNIGQLVSVCGPTNSETLMNSTQPDLRRQMNCWWLHSPVQLT